MHARRFDVMNAAESRQYADIVGPDIGDVISEGSTLILPVGAVEQHGPHLPMSVDDVIATETASEVVHRFGTDLDLWQLPSLSVSKSNEHAWSPGTLWYSADTMMSVLRDLGRSISTTRGAIGPAEWPRWQHHPVGDSPARTSIGIRLEDVFGSPFSSARLWRIFN